MFFDHLTQHRQACCPTFPSNHPRTLSSPNPPATSILYRNYHPTSYLFTRRFHNFPHLTATITKHPCRAQRKSSVPTAADSSARCLNVPSNGKHGAKSRFGFGSSGKGGIGEVYGGPLVKGYITRRAEIYEEM